jgi:hypothetical protein
LWKKSAKVMLNFGLDCGLLMIRGIFVLSGSELCSFFKNFRSKLKYQKPTAVDVFFQVYPLSG